MDLVLCFTGLVLFHGTYESSNVHEKSGNMYSDLDKMYSELGNVH